MRRCVLVVAIVLARAGVANAQAWDDFGIDRFRLATSNGLLDVEWADVPGHKSWGIGLWAGFAHDPLVLYDRTMPSEPRAGAIVEQRVTTGLTVSIALWRRLELAVGFHAVGYQSTGSMVDAVMGIDALASAGAGDARFAPKLRLGGTPMFNVAVIPAVTYPIGSAEGFFREAGPTAAPELVLSVGRRVRGSANVGYRWRKTTVEIADLVVGDELFGRLGFGVRLGENVENPAAELAVTGSFAMAVKDGQANERSIETLGGVTVRATRDLRFFAAGGVGLADGFGTPDWRAVAGVRVQRARGDRDFDGFEDFADRCPDEAEDKDGFEDQDGCVDPDNDGDGLADKRDKDPNNPEDKDGFQDDDGAPDLDNDADGLADTADKCPDQAEDKDGILDEDGCPDASGKLRGKVVDAEGRPIPAAAVVVAQPDFTHVAPISVSTADDGTFTADVNAGTVKLTITANGYTAGEAPAQVGEGASADVSVTLVRVVRQGQIRGQVLSFSGKPLAATIKVNGRETKQVKTDQDGFFSLDLPEGKFSVSVESAGHTPQTRSVEVKVDRVTVVNVDMRKGKK